MPRRRALVLGVALLTFASTPLVAVAAGPYPPPSSGSASVNPSRIKAGQCTNFTGTGFASGASVDIRDDGTPAATATATANRSGAARTRLCFGTDARTGQHLISGTGITPEGPPRTVSAVLTITGVEQSGGGSSAGSSTGTTPGTTSAGVDQTPGALVVTGPEAVGAPDGSSVPRTDAGGVGGNPSTAGSSGFSLSGLVALATFFGLLLALVVSAWLLLLIGRRRERERVQELSV